MWAAADSHWWSSHQWMAQMSASLCLYPRWMFSALASTFGLFSFYQVGGVQYISVTNTTVTFGQWWDLCCINFTELVVKLYSQSSSVIGILCFIYVAQNDVNHYSDFYSVCHLILLTFVKIQAKLINFDGISKSPAVILDFWISQGNVALTQLGWGGKPYNSCIESFIRNLSVKEFWKSVYICRSYD